MYKTLVIGASLNSARASYEAVKRLARNGHPVTALGIRAGNIEQISIVTERPLDKDFHTITLYLNPARQEAYYDYILELKPERLIFNPGTENPALGKLAKESGIEVMNACTLVMLSVGTY